jgi:type I restriction enzyme S subunit
MTAQDLKNSILQLAMQGKLVPQDPNDEPASELLKRIKLEKTRLIKEGKIRKEKSSPPISENENPFDIPQGWEWARLASIGFSQTGNTPSTSNPEYFGDELPFITPGDILDGNICYDNRALSGMGKTVGKYCAPGTILQVCIGGSIGKAAVTEKEVAFNQQINTLSPILCDSDYILLTVTSGFFVYMMKEKAGGTATPIINRGVWNTLLIPIPPLAEQKRIVAKIEELLPYIERYDESEKRLLELNKKFPDELRKSILQQAVQGKLTEQDPNDEPASELLKRIKSEKARLIKEGKIKKEKPLTPISEDEKPFEIPESWEWVRLSQIVYNFGQKIPDEEFCYIDVGSIDNYAGRLSETNTLIKPESAPSRARKVVTRGAILYSCVRPYLLNTCIVDREFPKPPIASTAFAVLMPYEGIYNKYLHLYLRGPSFVSYTNVTSTGQAYPAINDKRLYDAVIPVPPLEEQKRIVAKIEGLLPLCDRLK